MISLNVSFAILTAKAAKAPARVNVEKEEKPMDEEAQQNLHHKEGLKKYSKLRKLETERLVPEFGHCISLGDIIRSCFKGTWTQLNIRRF